jgi:SEC-C motif-containing protein/HEAT repeat protein
VTGPTVEDLIEQITARTYGMPVRPMQRVLAMGETAVPALADALPRYQDDDERDALWLIVLLGELRHPDGVAPLIQQMQRSELDMLALAAAEALAKIGPPAVSALAGVAERGDVAQRLYAYAALGWISDERAYAILVEALRHDRPLGDVLAMALADQGRAEAIAPLYEAYTSCEPWQRPEFEAALRAPHRGIAGTSPPMRDWRLRYRRLPELGDAFDLHWVGVLAVLRAGRETMPERPLIPVRPLQAILDEREPDEPKPRCEECGAPIEYHTGLPACPETAVTVAVYQLNLLDDAREDGIDDLFELLDEFEADEADYRDRGKPRAPRARARWREEVSELQMCRQSCQWLIEQDVETVEAARALLLAHAGRLADRYGDPEGLLEPPRPSRGLGAKVGRNDPCPCGSGLKYKRCCLGKT